MYFAIEQIVLWSRDPRFDPRTVDIKPGVVNVISGASQTGKSAIIPIIDYCLGADKCAIPVGPIRSACSWFGIIVSTREGRKLFARREPGSQKSTGDMFVLEGEEVTLPKTIELKNSTIQAVKARLDELAGLSRLTLQSGDDPSGFRGRPSFRDLAAFTFQPQNVIANPDVFFFKADTYEHREKLKSVFPFVLRAVSAEVLAAQHELDSARRSLARLQRELASVRDVSGRWEGELRSWALRAREYGLVAGPIADDASRDELLEMLRSALSSQAERPGPSTEGIHEAVEELLALDHEESEVASSLQRSQRRLQEMTRLKDNAARYGQAMATQRDRLALASWMEELVSNEHQCPLCDNAFGESGDLKELVEALASVEGAAERAGTAAGSFDRELQHVHDEIGRDAERLSSFLIRKREAQSRSDDVERLRFREAEVSRFLGSVERAIEVHESIGSDSQLVDRVSALEERVRELAEIVSKEGVAGRQRRALNRISLLAGRLLPGLEAERPNDPVELSITDLTVKVGGESREDYLWEIGSGANWLSYHIAMSLALQQFFMGGQSPVPSFLVYDQPSQVYFPRRLAGGSTEVDPVLEDEDVDAVRKVFTTIASVVASSQGEFQAIVLDHAGPDVFGGIDRVELVEEWRGEDKKLIPAKWL